MKKWNYLFMAMGVAMAMTACSDDMDLGENPGTNPEENVDRVFMQFALELPTASRSTTQTTGGSDAGVEIGQNTENTVSEVLVVITDGTVGTNYDKYITKSAVITPTSAGNNTYVVPFSSTALASYAGKPVNVYVFCNPTDDIKNSSEINVNDNSCKLTAAPAATNATIWTDNKFLMTNADDDYTTTMPESFNNYKVESSPFNIGTINVERAAARFDYKSTVANETYTLMGEDSDPEVTVTLTDMALVNMSQEFYYLRRVSADGTNTSATIGGTETNTNYVVDTDATWKSSYSVSTSDEASHFFYVYTPNSASTTDYAWTSISSLTIEDNDESWNSGENENTSKDGYKIWRYATENTIPAVVTNQKKGITTGVVFKGEIEAVKEGTTVKTAMNGTNTVYVYNDIMYGTWNDVKTAANSDPVLKLAYDKVGDTENKTTAVANGFTVFEPTTDGKYEVLYYYWNRHNDNNNDGSMGPMEFGVVRNNVYKLSVTGVNKFGHPTDPDNDPDPEDPEDPDESDNVYFSVMAKVLPWVVRVNDIEF